MCEKCQSPPFEFSRKKRFQKLNSSLIQRSTRGFDRLLTAIVLPDTHGSVSITRLRGAPHELSQCGACDIATTTYDNRC
jgi:hypothetical protein